MLFVSEDKTKFITTTAEGACCFTRTTHYKEAKERGLNLSQMENITAQYHYSGKGKSFKDFLNQPLT